MGCAQPDQVIVLIIFALPITGIEGSAGLFIGASMKLAKGKVFSTGVFRRVKCAVTDFHARQTAETRLICDLWLTDYLGKSETVTF